MSKQIRRIERAALRLDHKSTEVDYMRITWQRRSKKPLPKWKRELLSLPNETDFVALGRRYGKSELTRLQLEKV